MITSTQGSLVMVGLNTRDPQIFWNGVLVSGVTDISIDNDTENIRVVFRVKEGTPVTELKNAGIIIKKGV